MVHETTKESMQNTIADQNNVPTALKELLHGIKPSKKDELLEVMEKTWITLNLSQKEALIAQATRASSLNQAIARFQETQMEALKVKKVKENDK